MNKDKVTHFVSKKEQLKIEKKRKKNFKNENTDKVIVTRDPLELRQVHVCNLKNG